MPKSCLSLGSHANSTFSCFDALLILDIMGQKRRVCEQMVVERTSAIKVEPHR
jgi:hypothetical protein